MLRKGATAGAGGDQDHVLDLRLQHEEPVRTVEVSGLTDLAARKESWT